MARVAVKAARAMVVEWNLSTAESERLLGILPEEASANGEDISDQQLERISVLLGIYKATNTLFPTHERAAAYLRQANQALAGRSAMEVMLEGSVADLYKVRRYLEAWCG